ncbi:MAG: helix-turn-helix domain-containing protein, partial [Haloarculaceae archaeon]
MDSDGTPERTLASVEKAFDVVETLWELEGAGVTAVAEALDLPKSTVHAHLATLESKGYVVSCGGKYRLSLRFLTFGEHVRRAEPLFHAARGPVEDLAERTGERVLCMTEQNGLGMVLHAGEGSRSLSGDVSVGTHVYHHCSAGGKAMMAHYPRER